jgi:hypothetical protein
VAYGFEPMQRPPVVLSSSGPPLLVYRLRKAGAALPHKQVCHLDTPTSRTRLAPGPSATGQSVRIIKALGTKMTKPRLDVCNSRGGICNGRDNRVARLGAEFF